MMSQVSNYYYKSKLTIFCHYWKSIRYKSDTWTPILSSRGRSSFPDQSSRFPCSLSFKTETQVFLVSIWNLKPCNISSLSILNMNSKYVLAKRYSICDLNPNFNYFNVFLFAKWNVNICYPFEQVVGN